MFKEVILKLKKIFYSLKTDDNVYYINGPETLPAPLNKEDEKRAFDLLEQNDDKAKEILITHNLRLVVYISKKFESSGVGIEDLISIGTIGLIKAVNSFVPAKNIKLATYASRCIENEILMHLRKQSKRRGEISIDEPLNVDWDGNELLLSDILGTENDTVIKDIEQDAVRKLILGAIEDLKGRECEIMQLRFGIHDGVEYTQKQVSEKIGISQSYISRLEKRIIKKLKTDMSKIV